MPRKKVRKEKSREYLERLLDRAGVSDSLIAKKIREGMDSDEASERTKALDLVAKWKGFYDADKKVGTDIEKLPIANISLEDLDRLSNRCSYCIHKKFQPCKTAAAEPKKEETVKEPDEPNQKEAAD